VGKGYIEIAELPKETSRNTGLLFFKQTSDETNNESTYHQLQLSGSGFILA
jgi:hypothetical protein